MINGFFELSSNRRDIWQSGSDMTGDGKTRAIWNISIIKEIIATSYIRLLCKLRNILGFTKKYQLFWPNSRITAAPWSELVLTTLLLSRNQKLLKIYRHNISDSSSNNMIIQSNNTKNTNTTTSSSGGGSSTVFSSLIRKKTSTTTNTATTSSTVEEVDLTDWISSADAVLLPIGMHSTHRQYYGQRY